MSNKRKKITLKQRNKIFWLHWKGLSIRQIAKKVNIPKSTIHWTLHHYIIKLAKRGGNKYNRR
jgi:IS30 family transposase